MDFGNFQFWRRARPYTEHSPVQHAADGEGLDSEVIFSIRKSMSEKKSWEQTIRHENLSKRQRTSRIPKPLPG